LVADSFPGTVCDDHVTVGGAELQSTLRTFWDNFFDYSSCEITFLSKWGYGHLMLKFETFDISEPGVELKIIRTSGPDVRLFHCVIVIVL